MGPVDPPFDRAIYDDRGNRAYNELCPMLKTHPSSGYFSNLFQSPSAGRHGMVFLLSISVFVLWGFQDARSSPAWPTGQEPSRATSESGRASTDNDLALVQEAVRAVRGPDSPSLEKTLGVDLAPSVEEFADSSSTALVELGDLDGDEFPEFALKRMRSERGDGSGKTEEDNLQSWGLFLLTWDGTGWHASLIHQGFEPFEISVISSLFPGSRQIVLVVYAGTGEIPYPSIYRLKDHNASLVWDGRADDSDYQGYAHGKVEFRATHAGSAAQLVVTGRADPGLLHFPAAGQRGFDAQASYIWDGKSYTENKTVYSANEDRTLYQFIAALHLHDFRSAYALVDPPKFLRTDQPSLDMFRKLIEGSWQELLDDQVFKVPEEGSEIVNPFQFERTEESKHYIYLPSFGAEPKK